MNFALLLSFPGIRPPQYPIGRYPTIAEFRLMLAALDQETATTHWKGEYFFALRGCDAALPASVGDHGG
jgi:hypothetical protein